VAMMKTRLFSLLWFDGSNKFENFADGLSWLRLHYGGTGKSFEGFGQARPRAAENLRFLHSDW